MKLAVKHAVSAMTLGLAFVTGAPGQAAEEVTSGPGKDNPEVVVARYQISACTSDNQTAIVEFGLIKIPESPKAPPEDTATVLTGKLTDIMKKYTGVQFENVDKRLTKDMMTLLSEVSRKTKFAVGATPYDIKPGCR